MSKIEKLTPQQELDLKEYHDTYLKFGLSCEPADKAAAESAFSHIYAIHNLKEPNIIWVDSPMSASYLIHACEKGKIKNFDEMRKLGKLSLQELKDHFPKNFKPDYKSTYFWGQQDLYWVAFYKFCEHIGVEYEAEKLEKLNLMDAIGKSCMWFYVFENAVVACNRAESISMNDRNQLHNEAGPSVSFRDGFKIYNINGVRIPELVVMNPELITVDMIESEQNAEVRRVMTQRYGYERYLLDSGAEVVHELPENYFIKGLQTAKLLIKERNEDTPVVMIDCLNSTPEPDGTIKRYMIRVDPTAYEGEASKNVHAAMASTWRNEDGTLYFKNWNEYRPQFES